MSEALPAERHASLAPVPLHVFAGQPLEPDDRGGPGALGAEPGRVFVDGVAVHGGAGSPRPQRAGRRGPGSGGRRSGGAAGAG